MSSFLKRFSSIKGKRSSSTHANKIDAQQQHNQQPHDNKSDIVYELTREIVQRSNAMSNDSDSSSSSYFSITSNLASPTLSSDSSISLFLTEPLDTTPSSRRPSTEILSSKTRHQSNNKQEQPYPTTTKQEIEGASSSSEAPVASSFQVSDHSRQQSPHSFRSLDAKSSQAETPSVPDQSQEQRAMKGDAVSNPFDPRSKSIAMLENISDPQLPDTHGREYQSAFLSPVPTLSALSSSRNASMDHFSLLPPPSNLSNLSSPTSGGKKKRLKTLSSLLLQHEQQLGGQPPLPCQSKNTRWNSRGGIRASEMMVDLETTGVFVPSGGQRLRAEFVYRTVIRCADEIRRRGLDHPRIFHNLSPKKVISSMISLLTDQHRCDLYSIQCLRIDTVAGLMLNLLSQMSNPVIPYAVMGQYFKRGGPTRSPALSNPSSPARQQSPTPNTTPLKLSRTPSPINSLLPAMPALSLRGGSQTTMAWAREHFDLSAFLQILPEMNRVILLEVLHLCQEVLDHQLWNKVTLTGLVQQVAPALFSTVFDKKILHSMAGGAGRYSVHGAHIGLEEGTRAENHLFMTILVRFLHMTTRGNTSNSGAIPVEAKDVRSHYTHQAAMAAASAQADLVNKGMYNQNIIIEFRKSHEKLQQQQQEYYRNIVRFYQEVDIRQQPPQRFGVYSASQKQQLQLQQQQQNQHYSTITPDQSQDRIVPELAMSAKSVYPGFGMSTVAIEVPIGMLDHPGAAMNRAQQHSHHLYRIHAQAMGKGITA